MKRYIGTKQVNAAPMTRQEYNDFRGWELPADEDGSDAGYLVEYVDGGKANTEQFKGYVSWSPVDVFERAYVECLVQDSNVPPYQHRVVEERNELKDKSQKLLDFIQNSPAFMKLSQSDQVLLIDQLETMIHYRVILESRIERFNSLTQ